MINLPILTVVACMFMAVFMLIFNEDIINQSMYLYQNVPTTPFPSPESVKITQDDYLQCILPKYDSWDNNILYWFNPLTGQDDKCNEFKILSKLENGKIVSLDEDYDCFGRCITRSTDYKNIVGKFRETNETFDCDIVEAHCFHVNATNASYAMIHTQIVPKASKKMMESVFPKYNVFVILVDSMATSQADRNIPKTMYYLEKSMDAITFPYVNKVGVNSRPNGIALWFGKQIEAIDRTVYGIKTIQADLGWRESCDDYIDNYTSIFKDFNDQGYMTFLADDWAEGVLNWPDCYGFDKQPTDHIMQPFQLAIENKSNELLHGNYTEENCIYQHRDQITYLNQFIDAYKDRPKFAWLWSSLQSHDYESSSVRMDTDLYAFLLDNKKELDNSFVIFMGDHGLRFGDVTNTRLGALDVNNPLLTIAVPKELRQTEMVKVMKKNSGKLQTHYDTRATLLDIAKHLPSIGSRSLSPINDTKERGESLFREQSLQERNCKTLPISFAYCICEFRMENISKTSLEAIEIGQAVLSFINGKLMKKNVTEECNLWIGLNIKDIAGYYPRLETRAYSVTLGVKEPYPKAEFRAKVHRSKDGKFTVGGVDRMDSYGRRGDCVSGELAPICDCKEQGTSTTEDPS